MEMAVFLRRGDGKREVRHRKNHAEPRVLWVLESKISLIHGARLCVIVEKHKSLIFTLPRDLLGYLNIRCSLKTFFLTKSRSVAKWFF